MRLPRATLAALLLLGALLAPAARATGPRAPGTPLPATPTGAVAPTPVPPTTSFVRSFWFSDARRGWMLVLEQPVRRVVLRTTTDGGRTWAQSARPPVDLTESSAALPDVRWVRFANERDGWLFGPDALVTHDGGKSWAAEPRQIRAIALVGRSVWAVEVQESSVAVVESTDGGRTWRELLRRTMPANEDVQLVRSGRRSAALLVRSQHDSTRLLTTRDGGRTWRELPVPGDVTLAPGCALATHDGRSLWLLLGGVPAGEMQSKRLYRSSDGGLTWSIPADTPYWGSSLGELTISGSMLAPEQLAATSPTRAFLGLNRNTLQVTEDGGRRWRDSIPPELGNPGDRGIQQVQFVDGRHGWALSGPTLFRTADGGASWQATPIP